MGNELNVAGAPGALPWSVFESGLWLRAGIAGAGAALVAPALVAGGEASLAGGAAAFAAGAALAVFSYRRTRGLLGMDRVCNVEARSHRTRAEHRLSVRAEGDSIERGTSRRRRHSYLIKCDARCSVGI